MSPQFTINFRREVYQQQLARTRRRAVSVGSWLAYFGLFVIVLGLYALNCASLVRRTEMLAAQNRSLSASAGSAAWKPPVAELAPVERALANPRTWRLRLSRLAALLPPNVALTSVGVAPDEPAGAGRERLAITGVLRPLPGQDRMQGIMALVSTLHGDSVFASQYRTIRLVESRIGGADAPAEFRIECR